jgi:hypothetical protein
MQIGSKAKVKKVKLGRIKIVLYVPRLGWHVYDSEKCVTNSWEVLLREIASRTVKSSAFEVLQRILIRV